MNKPGGTAWVLSIHENNVDGSTEQYKLYDVKYILNGNQDHNIPDYFIGPHEELERRSRKRGTTSEVKQPPPQVVSTDIAVSKERKSSKILTNKKNKPNTVSLSEKAVGIESELKSAATLNPHKRCSICLKNHIGSCGKTEKSYCDEKDRDSLDSKSGRKRDRRICILPSSLESSDTHKLDKFLSLFAIFPFTSTDASESSGNYLYFSL